jgi:hypothetical protein
MTACRQRVRCSKGKWTGGIPILGYDVNRSSASPKLVVNAEEVRRIFTLSKSCSQAASRFNH